ncbi:glycosyltransferase family 4 protein [Natrinema salsiterrestre]|uniref:Glycosyltransferase family 4 protein n=1 Tax=Natrinema salsiterrestre TaxID=2950540 RepID=A0A9Q4KYN0_9EURY|nr:glycosyltransferase family 4 protein [Natrinema salsiterrestre]MDF9743994.1 glycosyltransferase family 4 protein [Natrinema salsiterrestre]
MATVLYYGTSTQIHSGAAQWMYRLADRMREYGHDTIAVVPGTDGIAAWYAEAGIPTYVLEGDPISRRPAIDQLQYPFRVLENVRRLRRLIRTESVDLVHVNELRYPSALLAGTTSQSRTIGHVRMCLNPYHLRKAFGAMGAHLSDRVVCVSHRTADVMFRTVGYESNIEVLHDGLPSPDRFSDLPAGTAFRSEFGIDEDAPLAVCVSKLIRDKGQDRLLDAARRLRDEDLEFAVVGGTVEGHEAYARALERRVRELENVTLTGFYEDLPEVLGAADVLVHLPRHEDPFPGVVLEGMAAGLPVIGSQSGGIPEQIDDGETGYLVAKTGDIGTVVERLRDLAGDSTLRDRLGREARRRSAARFDPEAYFDEIDGLYTELAGG